MGEKLFTFNLNVESLKELKTFNPVQPELVGLPPLDFPKKEDETKEEYEERQNTALKNFVEDYLFIYNEGTEQRLTLIKPQLEFLTDAFFERHNKFILVKNRGGGGSLIAAIYMWMVAVYQGKSSVDIAGSRDQAQALYKYTKGFWRCLPQTKHFISGDITKTRTELINGTSLEAIPNSETAARSKHPHVLICDEACQRDAGKDDTLISALQMPLIHSNYTIIMLSTFHFAGGLFDEYYSTADQKGFKIYSWSTFDTMKKCTKGLELATKDDPLAIESYCKKKCILSFFKRKINPKTNKEYKQWIGCCGKARNSEGFVPRINVVEACELNNRETFLVEHCSGRPSTEGPIYDPDSLKECYRETDWSIVSKYENRFKSTGQKLGMSFPSKELLQLEKNGFYGHKMSVGIDWGYRNLMTCVGPVIQREMEVDGYDDLIIVQDRGWTGTSMSVLIQYLLDLKSIYGHFTVLADGSNGYGIEDLTNSGFETYPIHFNVWKNYGIQNICKIMEKQKLFINQEGCYGLYTTLPKYRRDKNGKPLKKDDHYADGLLCAMLKFNYEEVFGGHKNEEGLNVKSF